MTDVDHSVPIHLPEIAAKQLRTGTNVLWSNGQQSSDGGVDTVLRHLLQTHVGHLHLRHIRVLRVHDKHLVEHPENLRAVAAGLFVLLNGLTHHHTFALSRCLGAEDDAAHDLAGQRVLMGGTIVVVHRRLRIGVLGLFAQGSREQLQCFLLLVVLHQPVAHHHPIIHVAGVVVRQRFQRVPCSLLVTHHLVDAHLRQCDFLALSLDVLDAIDGAKHTTIVLVLLVELQQNLQHVGALALVAGQLLIDGLRLRIVPHAKEILSQPLLIDVVVGIQRCRLLQAQPRQRVFSQLTLIHRQVVPAFSGQWVDIETVAEQVVGGIVVACILLPHGLQEEIVVAQGVCR